jgi:hypothetical protein
MKITSALVLTIAALFMVSCSGSGEAKTRKEQEAEFNNAFGFHPPPTITTINYTDLSNRGVMDGAYDQWLSFTFDQASFDKIIQGRHKDVQSIDIPDGNAPAWWPKAIPSGTALFFRSQKDTSTNEGFQFQEYVWHDSTSGLVFFYKSYWD